MRTVAPPGRRRAKFFTWGARLSLGYLESSLEHYDTAWAYLDPSNPATGELPPERPVVHVPEMVEVLAALGRTDEARAKLAPFADRAPPSYDAAGRSPASPTAAG